MKTCRWCGKPIDDGRKAFCSQMCRMKLTKKENRLRHYGPVEPHQEYDLATEPPPVVRPMPRQMQLEWNAVCRKINPAALKKCHGSEKVT